jgi:hypothetical protein
MSSVDTHMKSFSQRLCALGLKQNCFFNFREQAKFCGNHGLELISRKSYKKIVLNVPSDLHICDYTCIFG